jgi:D-lyxose ketol-isomerase
MVSEHCVRPRPFEARRQADLVMITREEEREAREWAWDAAQRAGLVLRDEEIQSIAVADFGLSRLKELGAQILTLETNSWVSVKTLILGPWQLLPQHRHPPCEEDQYPGKTEVLRGQWGECYHYTEGPVTAHPTARPAEDHRRYLTVWNELVIRPAVQLTVPPNTWHWLQAGSEGAVVWSISSKSTDAEDQWVDPHVVRQTRFAD